MFRVEHRGVVPSAPRYDTRILDLVRALDDLSEPMAETCRRVGASAERLGLFRPSYVHLRRIIREERRRRAELREVLTDVADEFVRGVRVDPYEVAERLKNARR